MREQELPVAREHRGIPVADAHELRVRPQRLGQLPGHLRARGGIRAADGGDDEPCRRSGAQLLDEGALGRARVRGQERREVRAVAGPRGDGGGREREQHEAHRAAAAGACHGGISGPRVRSERSPSRSRISTVRIASRSPESVTSAMLRAIAASRGVRCRLQCASSPLKSITK